MCIRDRCDDDLPEELRNEDDLLSQLIGKNPLTIIGEMQIFASYKLLAKSDNPLNPLFAVEAVVEGETFRAAGNSKKLAKARAARDALRKLYNLEFGISESKLCAFCLKLCRSNKRAVTVSVLHWSSPATLTSYCSNYLH